MTSTQQPDRVDFPAEFRCRPSLARRDSPKFRFSKSLKLARIGKYQHVAACLFSVLNAMYGTRPSFLPKLDTLVYLCHNSTYKHVIIKTNNKYGFCLSALLSISK